MVLNLLFSTKPVFRLSIVLTKKIWRDIFCRSLFCEPMIISLAGGEGGGGEGGLHAVAKFWKIFVLS